MKKSNLFHLLLLGIVMFMSPNCFGQNTLFGIDGDATSTQFKLVNYNTTTGNQTTVMTFPSGLGSIWGLTYNPDLNVFYSFAHSAITDTSELLVIDACSYEVTNLGKVFMGGNPVYTNEGISYDPVSQMLYATVGTVSGGFFSSNLVNFQSLNLTIPLPNCTSLGAITQLSNAIDNEMDGLLFTGTTAPTSTLEGFDGLGGGGSLFNRFSVDYTSTNIGDATFIVNYVTNNPALTNIRGYAYDDNADLIYSVFNLNQLVSILPSYVSPLGTATPIVNLMPAANNIRGLAFMPDSLLCCFAAQDTVEYTQITNDVTYSNLTMLTGKFYVHDNVTITVDDATLDLTNVDMVFGQCAGIDFVNGASLRANNSVFRPCNMNETWRGLRFDGESDFAHQINENTFKNAEIALLFERDANAEINSNTFSNCNEGVKLDRSLFTETIFGNNFVTNDAYPVYANCYNTTSSNDVIHIHCVGSPQGPAASTMMITQNNFTMNNTSGTISATGVDMLNSQASISENTMTNMENGIVINDPTAETHIESNEIENNNLFTSVSGNLRQIFIDQSHGVYVSINYNELRNSIIDAPFMSNGIFLERSDNVSIQSNVLNGFHFGINSRFATVVNISENIFKSITDAAIYLDESGQMGTNFITCNDITMVIGRGFGIFTNGVDRLTEISSNCIKDGREAIHLVGNSTLPLIRNNYMYNYAVGVNNNGHTGNIGTSTTDPGMNTFWSNNNGAIDINSFPTINIANNFGVFNITGAFITQNNPTHSTASCGHQLVSGSSQGSLNTNYTCDNNDQFLQPKGKSNGSISMPSVNNAIAFLKGASNKMNVIRQFVYLEGCDLDYLTDIMNGVEITEQDKNMILYTYHKFNSDFAAANVHLDLLIGSDYENLVEVERLVIKNAGNDPLTQSDYAHIESILNSNELDVEQYNVAVALSKTGSNHGMYRTAYPEISSGVSGDFVSIKEDKTTLELFPNPSTDEINVRVLEGKIVAGQELIIYDMYGNTVQSRQMDFISGDEKVNISDLSSGTYFVVLVSDGVRSERTKFIKL